MIEFKPLNENSDLCTYEAYEGGKALGSVTCNFEGYNMTVTSLVSNDDFVKEGLLRSIMNYCANRGAYLCKIGDEMLCPAAERLGFKEGKLTVEIPEALTGSCCSCNK